VVEQRPLLKKKKHMKREGNETKTHKVHSLIIFSEISMYMD
jgi:hypothetical protein